jgi:hypothetical protein
LIRRACRPWWGASPRHGRPLPAGKPTLPLRRMPRPDSARGAGAINLSGGPERDDLLSRLLRFEIEFFLRSHDQPDGKTIRRNSGQFASEKDVETYGLLKAHLRRTASEFGRMVCCEKRSRSVPTQKPTARLDVESAACRLPPRVRFGFGGGKSIRPIYFSPASTRGLFFVRRSPRLRNQQRA